MPKSPLADRLEHLVATQDRASRVASDPVSFVRRFSDPRDQEVVGLIAALLAFGNVKAVLRSVERVMAVVGPDPKHAVQTRTLAEWRRLLHGFVHRVYRGDDVAVVLANAGMLQRKYGSLGVYFAGRVSAHDGALAPALADFADALRTVHGAEASRGLRHLVPDPNSGSACKRLLLYLRWMIRAEDGVDVGAWPIAPSILVIPVDTHIHRIARNLGLTRSKTASWRTAEEITTHLRVFNGADPVRFDFALCHHGISGDCPSRRDPARCEPCVLRPVCRHWTRPAPKRRRRSGAPGGATPKRG